MGKMVDKSRQGLLLIVVVMLLHTLVSGCSISPHKKMREYEPASPQVDHYTPVNNGSIYQEATARALFEDNKAKRVGDVINIVLTERTSASKSASTSTSKDSSFDTGTPTVFGRPVTSSGVNILGAGVETEHAFNGSGDSAQSNSLTGTVSVTVSHILGNGNLRVRGQKRIVLNRGEEYIQISGIVRPSDVRSDNTVPSTLLADANIRYSGRGELADANAMGWITRFFNSPIWPF